MRELPVASSPETASDLDLPGFLGKRFRARALLGSGAFGRVVLAVDRGLSRKVAIKLLTDAGPGVLERFQREGRVTSLLSHPNIAAIYDTGEAEGVPYIVYQYIEGKSFRGLLEDGLRFDAERVRTWAVQIAGALQAVHEVGILHRDLKPDNIMLRSRDYGAVLVDFGLASSDDPDEGLTRTGAVVGTARYMAPEAMFLGLMDTRSDQYSLAATLVTVLMGRIYERPHLKLQGRSDEDLFPYAPVPWMAALGRALAWDPGARFPDMAGFREALEKPPEEPIDWEELARLRAPPPPVSSSSARRRVRRRGSRGSGRGPVPQSEDSPTHERTAPREIPEGQAGGADASPEPSRPVSVVGLLGVLSLVGFLFLLGWSGGEPPEPLPDPDPPVETGGDPGPGRVDRLGEASRALLSASIQLRPDSPPEDAISYTLRPGKLSSSTSSELFELRGPLRFRRYLGALRTWLEARGRRPTLKRPPVFSQVAVLRGLAFVSEVQTLGWMVESPMEWGPADQSLADRSRLVGEVRSRFQEYQGFAEDFLLRLERGLPGGDPEVAMLASLISWRLSLPPLGHWLKRLLLARRPGPYPDPEREELLRRGELKVLSGRGYRNMVPCSLRADWVQHYLETPWVRNWSRESGDSLLGLTQLHVENCPGVGAEASLALANRVLEEVPGDLGNEEEKRFRDRTGTLRKVLRAQADPPPGPLREARELCLERIRSWQEAHPGE